MGNVEINVPTLQNLNSTKVQFHIFLNAGCMKCYAVHHLFHGDV